ncbi:MAG: hypothetical protein AB1540_11330 [Bdellovibrionota bacterium]
MRSGGLTKQLGRAVLVAVVSLWGCSSSVFTGDKGSELDHLKKARESQINKACFGMNLSGPTLDVRTARSLIHCLNANGSLQEYQELIDSMSDEQVGSLNEVVNELVLTNNLRLKLIDKSFDQMDAQGLLDRSFQELSKIFVRGKMIRNGLKLVRQTVSETGPPGSAPKRKLDPSVLASIRILTQEISGGENGRYTSATFRKNLARALDLSISTTSSKSYDALVRGLRTGLTTSPFTLEYFSRLSWEYVKNKIEGERPLAKILLWGMEDNSILEAFDHYYTRQCDNLPPSKCPANQSVQLDLDHQVRAMESFMRILTFDEKETILDSMVELYRTMDAPIECMGGTKKIPNADLYVMDEFLKRAPLDVPQWSIRTNMLKMKLANSMCKFPNGAFGTNFNDLVNVLKKLAVYTERDPSGNVVSQGRPLVTVAHFLRALEVGEKLPMSSLARADLGRYMRYSEDERYRRFLIDWIGDRNQQVNIYTHLADTVGELARAERAALGNALYLLNVAAPDSQDRVDLRKAIRVLMVLRNELKVGSSQVVPGSHPTRWRSLYDVFSQALLKVEFATLYDLLSATRDLLDSPDHVVNPLLRVSRDAVLINDKNPVLDILIEMGLNAEKYERFFYTLFDVVDSDQFEGAMRKTAEMAVNGDLKVLLQGILTMFRGNTRDIPDVPTVATVLAPPSVDPSRDLSTFTRGPWNPLPPNWPLTVEGAQACVAIDVDIPFSQTGSGKWNDQMGKIASCVNANGNNIEVANLLNYGKTIEVREKKSILAFLVDLAADIIPGENLLRFRVSSNQRTLHQTIYDELSDLMTDDPSLRDMKEMNSTLPFLFGKKYCSSEKQEDSSRCASGAEHVSIFQSLFRGFSSFVGVEPQLQGVLDLAKKVVEDPKMPKSAALLYDISDDVDLIDKPIVADRRPPLVSYPLNNYPQNNYLEESIKKAIRKYLKHEPSGQEIAAIKEAYFREPLQGQLKRYRDYRNRERIGYKNAEELKKELKPLLDELAIGDRLEWTMRFFYFFDHNPYTPEWWASWFRRAANHVRVIPYYYPGTYPDEHPPSIRLVSQLDLMDLIVHDADFTLKRFGQSGFGIIGEEENFAIKYLTLLAQCDDNMNPAIDAMRRDLDFFGYKEGLAERFGFLIDKEVRRRLFNLNMIFPVLREQNRVTEFKTASGAKIYANDLGVLRDMFKRILSATPPSDRNNYSEEKNSLIVVTKLVSFSLLRNAGPNIWFLNENPRPGTRIHGEDDDGRNRHVVPNEISHILGIVIDSMVKKESGVRTLNPDMLAVTSHLIREDCDKTKPQYRNLPCVLPKGKDPRSFDERYVFIGKLVDQIFEWIKDDDRLEDQGKPRVMTLIKRAGYDLTILIHRLAQGNKNKRAELMARFGAALRPWLATSEGVALLGDNLDLIEDLIKNPDSIHFVEQLLRAEFSDQKRDGAEYKDRTAFSEFRELTVDIVGELAKNEAALSGMARDVVARVAVSPDFEAFGNALDWLEADPEYIDFRHKVSDRVVRQVVRWLPKDSAPRQSRTLRPRLQQYLGTHLGNGDMRNLILFIGEESSGTRKDVFYEHLRFLGDRSYVNKLNDFLDLLRSGIVDVYPSRR